MKTFRMLGMSVVLSVLMGALTVHADESDPYVGLRERYLKLRNTDIRLTKEEERRVLAEQLAEYANHYPESKHASSALFNAAVMREQRYRKLHDELDVETAVGLLERLIRNYPSTPLIDQALLRLGDILLNDFNKKNAARLAYDELVKRFPRSTLVVSARMRRDTIEAEAEGKPAPLVNPDDLNLKSSGDLDGPLIVLDPGHGGEDFGAVGVGDLMEKEIVFDVAQRLKALLETRMKARVVLTRDEDRFVPLAERTELANAEGAEVFLSLHVNASPLHNQEGLEIYYLDNSNDQASLRLAERENGPIEREGTEGDLAFMLSDLIQSGKLEESRRLAETIHTELKVSTRGKVKSHGVRKAPFYVLVGAHMPCVLAELLFVDHPGDAKQLAKSEFRKELAEGLYQGLKNFLKTNEKRNPKPSIKSTPSTSKSGKGSAAKSVKTPSKKVTTSTKQVKPAAKSPAKPKPASKPVGKPPVQPKPVQQKPVKQALVKQVPAKQKKAK